MHKEELQRALECAERCRDIDGMYWWGDVVDSLKAALEAKDEPVAWMCADESLINKGYARFSHVCMGEWKIPVYITPPQRTWVGLTDDEKETLSYKSEGNTWTAVELAEAKLKERNT